MKGKSQSHSKTATCFEEYLAELGDRVGDAERRAALETEFRCALGTLVRHRYESSHNLLHGQKGLELVHETLTRVLHEGLGDEPGALMRLVSKVGHRLFRSRAGSGISLDEARARTGADVPSKSSSCNLEFPSLDQDEQAFLRTLMECEIHKNENGRFHYEKLAKDLGITTKALRRRLRLLLNTLGRGLEYQQFWFKRLAEASLELLRIRTEEELGDLLGSRLQTQRRLRLVLFRLKSYGAESSLHPDLENKSGHSRALRLLRMHQRKPTIPYEVLATAARLLGADSLALDLIKAESLRAEDRPDAALELLTPWRVDSLPPRRSLLLRLARARCLERLGRAKEASELLESSLQQSRADPIFQYNRFVLARQAGNQNRADAALRELRQRGERKGLSPLLQRGIRLALDQEPK